VLPSSGDGKKVDNTKKSKEIPDIIKIIFIILSSVWFVIKKMFFVILLKKSNLNLLFFLKIQ
jgi:hypothetical protein